MKAERDSYWLLISPDGGRPHQVCMAGNAQPGPSENPDGLRVLRVSRHSHDPRERFDEKSRRWKLCPVLTAEHEARERAAAVDLAAQLSDAVIEALADRIAAKLEERRMKP